MVLCRWAPKTRCHADVIARLVQFVIRRSPNAVWFEDYPPRTLVWLLSSTENPGIGNISCLGEPDLAQVVFALDRLGIRLGSAQRRKQQRRQDGDDGDDDEELNQGERKPSVWPTLLRTRLSPTTAELSFHG